MQSNEYKCVHTVVQNMWQHGSPALISNLRASVCLPLLAHECGPRLRALGIQIASTALPVSVDAFQIHSTSRLPRLASLVCRNASAAD